MRHLPRPCRSAPIAAQKILVASVGPVLVLVECAQCGNNYDQSFEVTMGGRTLTFDSFECAICRRLVPVCPHCGAKVLVHGDLCGPVNIMAGNRRLQADILHSAHRKCDDETHVPLSIHPVSSTCFLKVRQVFLRRASVAGTPTLPASNHAVD